MTPTLLALLAVATLLATLHRHRARQRAARARWQAHVADLAEREGVR